MKTISSSEFIARPDFYLDMAINHDVCIKKGSKLYHLVCEPSTNEQPILSPDDDFRRAITAEEFKERMRLSIHKFFANKP
jgi:hypothetical protein